MPRISVILPAYNAERYLDESLQSIHKQLYRDFEVWVIDDGSTDRTREIVESWSQRDKRIRLLSRPNTGIVGALNDGISHARGEFIARMDADDIALPQRFQQQVGFLDRNPSCVGVGTDVFYTDPEGSPLVRHHPYVSHDDIVDQLALGNGGAIIHPTLLVRAETLQKTGLYRPEFQWVEDLDLYMRLSRVGMLHNLPEVLLHYRQHPQSVNKRIPNRTKLIQKLVDEYRQALAINATTIEPPSSTALSVSDFRRNWAFDALKGNQLSAARKNAAIAIRKSPFDRRNWQCLRLVNSRFRQQHPHMSAARRIIHGWTEALGWDERISEAKVNLRIEAFRSRKLKTLSAIDGNSLIGNTIRNGKPAAIAKIGDRECSALSWHLGLKQFYKYTWSSPGFGESDLTTQGGVFPNTPEFFHKFAEIYLDRLREMDVMATWLNPGETKLLQGHCPSAKRMELVAFDSYFFEEPWSAALAQKKVLVVHPFEESITAQHLRLDEVWKSHPKVMPKFELRHIKSPYGFSSTPFATWEAMLHDMEEAMTKLHATWPFDVALLGCGAAGLPLAAHAKRLGAIGIHTGGITQILFGIRGGRWDSMPEFQMFFNDAWIRPSRAETPAEFSKVDKAGYW